MGKYKLWNKVDIIYTYGAPYKFTPAQWLQQFPWAEVEPCVISGEGVVNGAFCMPYSDFIAKRARDGCDFSGCETAQEHLDAIEAFEAAMSAPSTEPTAEERIAAAMEYQNALAE